MILVINAGSSSIKVALFDGARLTLRDAVSGIGTREGPPDHVTALRQMFDRLADAGVSLDALQAAGHRVVHGGMELTAPARITPTIRAAIADCARLAPLHNPHNLAAIDALTRLAPGLPQVACFDTAFHATAPEVARRYALPDRPGTGDIRRYGFHGLSYAALCRRLPEMTGAALPRRVLALHLGNGASACAILDGRSVATTMGYSPLEGLTMGTRSGSIDGNAVLDMAEQGGIEATRHMLNHESGLLGLSGLSADMRVLTESDKPEAAFAVAHFCHWAARHAASLIPAMEGIDALVFTGGIGENAATIRDRIAAALRWVGDPPCHIVPADEEAQIALETRACLAGPDGPEVAQS